MTKITLYKRITQIVFESTAKVELSETFKTEEEANENCFIYSQFLNNYPETELPAKDEHLGIKREHVDFHMSIVQPFDVEA